MHKEIIFYNGFNLAVDVAIFIATALWFHGVGYRKAKRIYKERMKNYVKPPF